jgi:predicted metalloprotease
MEGLGLGTIVVMVLVVWYLGKSINAIIGGAGAMAEDEFIQFRREQKLRIKKDNQSIKHRAAALNTQDDMSDEELDKLLGLS